MTTTSIDDASNALTIIYQEAGEWVRMVNLIVWTAGTVIISIIAAALGLSFQYYPLKWPIAFGSVALYGFWMYMSYSYGHSARTARSALMEIELRWGVPPDSPASLYGKQGQVASTSRGMPTIQRILLAVLLAAWVVRLACFKP
jgi:hypothetical protein